MISASVMLSIDFSMYVAGPVDGRVELDAGEAGLHRRERLLDPLRDLECVRLRELLDDEHEPGAVALRSRRR